MHIGSSQILSSFIIFTDIALQPSSGYDTATKYEIGIAWIDNLLNSPEACNGLMTGTGKEEYFSAIFLPFFRLFYNRVCFYLNSDFRKEIILNLGLRVSFDIIY